MKKLMLCLLAVCLSGCMIDIPIAAGSIDEVNRICATNGGVNIMYATWGDVDSSTIYTTMRFTCKNRLNGITVVKSPR